VVTRRGVSLLQLLCTFLWRKGGSVRVLKLLVFDHQRQIHPSERRKRAWELPAVVSVCQGEKAVSNMGDRIQRGVGIESH